MAIIDLSFRGDTDGESTRYAREGLKQQVISSFSSWLASSTHNKKNAKDDYNSLT